MTIKTKEHMEKTEESHLGFDPQKVRAKLSLKALRRAAIFMGKSDIRYYINGVMVERCSTGGAYLIGTCGHAMLVQHDPDAILEGADKFVLKVSTGLLTAAKSKRIGRHVGLIISGGRLSIGTSPNEEARTFEVFVQAGDPFINCSPQKLVNWRKVLPTNWRVMSPGPDQWVNPRFMVAINEAAAVESTKYGPAVRLWSDAAGEKQGIYAQIANEPNVIMCVMPMREDRTVNPPALLQVIERCGEARRDAEAKTKAAEIEAKESSSPEPAAPIEPAAPAPVTQPELSAWLPGHTKPWEPGVYQRLFTVLPDGSEDVAFSKWDGRIWFFRAETAAGAERAVGKSGVQAQPWRGLGKPPVDSDASKK